MAYNRFTRSKQLSEETFVGLLFDYLIGVPASVCSDRLGVKADTVNTKFQRFSERAATEPAIGGVLCLMPKKEDPIWGALFDCIFECEESEEFPLAINSNFQSYYRNKRTTVNTFTWRKNRKKDICSSCPLPCLHKIDDSIVRSLFYQSNLTKKFHRKNFYYYFIRSNITESILRNRCDISHFTQSTLNQFLKSFRKRPL